MVLPLSESILYHIVEQLAKNNSKTEGVNMRKNNRKIFAILLSMATFFSSVTVNAAYSDWLVFPNINGIGYRGQTGILREGSNMVGTAQTRSTASVPAGSIGASARLYRNGYTVSSTSVRYNTSAGVSILVRTPTNTAKGQYNTGGVAYIKATSGWKIYDMISSPYQTMALLLDDEIPRNENGEIFGSEYYLLSQYNIQPDLISAIGIDGTEGYIKYTDVNFVPKTIEEAIAYNPDDFEIPLYEDDGETVIGSFLVEAPSEVSVE